MEVAKAAIRVCANQPQPGAKLLLISAVLIGLGRRKHSMNTHPTCLRTSPRLQTDWRRASWGIKIVGKVGVEFAALVAGIPTGDMIGLVSNGGECLEHPCPGTASSSYRRFVSTKVRVLSFAIAVGTDLNDCYRGDSRTVGLCPKKLISLFNFFHGGTISE